MTWWTSPAWLAYEAVYKPTIPRAKELAAATWKTRVIELDTWDSHRSVKKTMRQAIEKGQYVTIWGDESVFDLFIDLHIAAAHGLPPRSPETYDMQRQWVATGLARLYFAIPDYHSKVADAVGACLTIRYNGWQYYASGPSIERNVMPRLIIEAIRRAKGDGDHTFEMGWQGHATDEKGKQIEFFKSRFGGEDVPANYLAMQEQSV